VTDINRREFAGSVLLAALTPVLGIGPVSVESGRWERGVEAAADDLDALAKALADVIRVQYGGRLGPDDLATVTRQIRTGLARAEEMRKVRLANSDEPDFVFSARPGPVS
jgi:hypothetical protein